jgi:hypothetical protein
VGSALTIATRRAPPATGREDRDGVAVADLGLQRAQVADVLTFTAGRGDIRFRDAAGVLVPFVTLALDMEAPDERPMPVQTVVSASSSDPQLAAPAINLLLRASSVTEATVEVSETPLRD